MNGKFFDLKKEKQDRMINGALKVFALYGYAHASTDEIVREAGISKGLLFHYFENKVGVYSFVFDYCTRFLMLELSSQYVGREADYFEIERVKLVALMKCAETYPYLPLFLQKTRQEDVFDALEVIRDKNEILQTAYATLEQKSSNTPDEKVRRITALTIDGMIAEAYTTKSFQAQMLLEELEEYLSYLRDHLGIL